MFRPPLALALTLLLGTSAVAQQTAPVTPPPLPATAPPAPQSQELVVDVTGGISAPMPIAIPAMATPAVVNTAAKPTDVMGRELAQIVTNDLKNSGLFNPLPPAQLRTVMFPEVTAPAFDYWGGSGAQALVQGFVRANGDGTLTVGCYLYDVSARTELARQGFVVSPGDWRRAAHKCADTVYARLTGEGPYFDSRIVYVSETGPKGRRIKRLAIMDQDGANHRFLTNGQSIVLTPRFAPNQQSIVYMSYLNDKPSIYVYDIGSGRQRLVVSNVSLAFAPRFSPDGRSILFSMAQSGNTDLYRVAASGGAPQRLTNSPGIDTGGSYSPDGRRIVFESDRSGGQQLYVMNADGSNQQRISFGGGRYATPVWSPRGDLIAFTKLGGAFRIGVMNANGGGEKLLTNSWQDEGPSWSPNGRVLTFLRSAQGSSGKADLWSVDLTGVNERKIPTPLDGSDPAWGPLRP
ncbi:Tol-Pal system beta propeller repeat protein TolB [Sphingomonas sp. SUN019]|uniref:Tol-Pal system beta propeller repeat protein TolB n=1 Tax=Sphingomonas sp. SUN019 TaxID=2937788 RepID=UPI002164B1B9|nr:Tol-Pal system beta propeller repeat protein TolB [Sphingomonas sp. SUN019]UVO51387.1 Tol-Pal system beta propeller repeat protein TolB [Sphingomonas sp. SUN019]